MPRVKKVKKEKKLPKMIYGETEYWKEEPKEQTIPEATAQVGERLKEHMVRMGRNLVRVFTPEGRKP